MLPMPCAKREGRQNGARTVRGVHAQRTRIMLRPILGMGSLAKEQAPKGPRKLVLGRSDTNQQTAFVS